MKELLLHLCFPQESNNHRSRLLHHSLLFVCIIILFFSALGLSSVRKTVPHILGAVIDISAEELLLLTNEKRQASGSQPLVLNEKLTLAAMLKAQDMFTKNYWAHNAPDGTTPWVFVRRADYQYTYAGENLARGFSTGEDVINAWMASPTHRENMLSHRYQEVGFAVVEGELLGEKTTLIVEMFGSTTPIARSTGTQKDTLATNNSGQQARNESQLGSQEQRQITPLIAAMRTKPFFNSFQVVKIISFAIVLFFIFLFAIDILIVEKKKISRFVGHNLDHIIYLLAILIIISVLTTGVII